MFYYQDYSILFFLSFPMQLVHRFEIFTKGKYFAKLPTIGPIVYEIGMSAVFMSNIIIRNIHFSIMLEGLTCTDYNLDWNSLANDILNKLQMAESIFKVSHKIEPVKWYQSTEFKYLISRSH